MPIARIALYAATVTALVVSAATAVGRMDSRWPVAVTLLAYCALIALGIFQPSLQVFADACTRAPRGIALVVDVSLAHMDAIDELASRCKARGATLTLALALGDAPQALSAELRARIARWLTEGHRVIAKGPAGRGEALLCALEAQEPTWTQLLGEPPSFWLASQRYSGVLGRIADAFDRTLLVPTADLRAIDQPELLATALRKSAHEGAIVRVVPGTALAHGVSALLDAAASLAVPVCALELSLSESEAL
ncbi:MAG: hypothetical protein Q8Q09_15720 [Deltaproteobacteria bacterium]|nr:hypothetical protein [Deltaproteobacteria bacterium]